MTQAPPPATDPLRPERPPGVAILAIWAGYAAGLGPILTTLGLLRTGAGEPFGLANLATLLLAGGVLFASIGTYRGHDRSRVLLVMLVTVHYSLRAFPALSALTGGNITAEQGAEAVGRLIGAIFWVGIYIWYFLRAQTLRYFRKPVGASQDPTQTNQQA